MNSTNAPVSYVIDDGIAIITINYPPVNALSQSVRAGLVAAIDSLEDDTSVNAIVVSCQGQTFIAGADIKEFGQPPSEPYLPDVVNRIEACHKPVIAGLFGTSLGGGFEVALACHYRLALSSAKVGLPEVNLGLIPGAGGTARTLRALGPAKALEMITSGQHVPVTALADSGLLAAIFADTDGHDSLLQQTLAFVRQQLAQQQLPVKRIGDQPVVDDGFDWLAAKAAIVKKARGRQAPVVAWQVLYDGAKKTIGQAMAIERQQFLMLRDSEQSAALRHAFSAEKMAAKIPSSVKPATAIASVHQVAVIGGGNMGSGIASAFLASGFEVLLIEQNETFLNGGLERIGQNFANNVKTGRMTQGQVDGYMACLTGSTDYQRLATVDLVIEAVFEDIEVKKTLFSRLDEICKDNVIFATNTSYLDINAIASVVKRPDQVVGMHFFSPANVMKLLEVVKATHTSEAVIASVMAVAKQLKKIAVLVGVCFGFAGNRMYTRYGREIQQMLLEGASVGQIDHAMTQWGMAMGPLAVQDLSGIDIGHNARSAQPFPAHDPGYFRAAATMVEAGRLGRKTQAGFYRYDEQGKAQVDDQVEPLIRAKAASLAIAQRTFSDEEIVHRALLALISEGLALLQDGIVQRWSDIDVIWLHGYGFPRHKGGPMFQAQQMGQAKVAAALADLQRQYGQQIWPITEMGF